jgi:O-antigen/teichoic acid export membrane protein
MLDCLLNKIFGTQPLRRLYASQLGQNILTNYLAVVWMGGLSIALIPIYLKLLGPDKWGVVAICMAIQGFLGLLDVGLGQIMPRDIARVAGDRAAEARVFRVFTRAYLGIGTIGLVLGQASVPWLIAHWFNQGQGVGDGADLALRLVLVQFFFQFANSAHTGYWNGLQSQKLANFRQCAFGTAKHAAALGLVYAWRADALAYLLPFALVSSLEWWANRRTVRRGLGELADGAASVADFRILAREAGVLALGVLIGMLVSQIDRIVLSRTVDVASFGRYVIVANLGMAFMQLQYPLMRAFFPRVVRADSNGGTSTVWQLGLGVFVLCVLPCALVAALAPWLLRVWLSDPQMVADGTTPLRLIIGAVAVNAVYHLIYQRLLIRGQGRLVVLINVIAFTVVTPLAVVAAREYGIVAGGLAWMLGAVVQLGCGVVWMVNSGARRL